MRAMSIANLLALLLAAPPVESPLAADAAPSAVLEGIRTFFQACAREDGSFRPGVDPAYRGMSDSAASDLAPVTYAAILHRTFGWKLPAEEATRKFLRSRQRKDGSFFHVEGTMDPDSIQGRLYNTTQGIVALRALGEKPDHDPLAAISAILAEELNALPPYSTSFFPLACLAAGSAYPAEADRKVRALMAQAPDGYLNEHIAATFHAVHYYRLLGEETPRAAGILERTLRDQKPDGSWLLHPPARDRHATFDAVFVIAQLGKGSPESVRAIRRAAEWALTCRNADGGFGHFPGSTSDADAVYFHIGTLVMAGVLEPAAPLAEDARLLGWGHLFPRPED
jgi:geranylgeranyl transferase type-2 subunit beta